MVRSTRPLLTFLTLALLLLFAGPARSDGLNQFGAIPAFSSGPPVAGTANVAGLVFPVVGDPLDRLFIIGTFNAAPTVWQLLILPGAGQFTVRLTGSPLTADIDLVFTTGVYPAQDQLVNAINFDLTRSDQFNVRRWYLLSLLRRLYS